MGRDCAVGDYPRKAQYNAQEFAVFALSRYKLPLPI